MNRDKLNMVSPAAIAGITFDLLDTMQNHQPEQATVALAILLSEIAEVSGVSVSELLDKARRITDDLNNHYHPQIKALREFVAMEM